MKVKQITSILAEEKIRKLFKTAFSVFIIE